MLEIHNVSDFQTGAKQAAQALTDALTHCRPDAVLLLFSGGSPLEIINYLPSDGFDARITIGVSDERFSTDPAVNNFSQIIATPWYEAVKAQGVQSIDTRSLPSETLEQTGMRFDGELKKWKRHNPSGKIVITQGIGLDGHTSGMMPYPEDSDYFQKTFIDTQEWVVGYDAGNKNTYPLRATTTVPFLKMVNLSILFVCGPSKQKPLADVLRVTPVGGGLAKLKSSELAAVPGRIIHHMKHCLLYTDLTIDTLK